MKYLTQHFSLEELTASETATRRGIDNSLPASLEGAATDLAQMLERIRDFLRHSSGREIAMQVTSGYRCLELNRAIGSSDSSDHVGAHAADFRAPSFGTPTRIAESLAANVNVLGIGQLINEFPDSNGWVHVSTQPTAKVINRIITIDKHGTTPGIHG